MLFIKNESRDIERRLIMAATLKTIIGPQPGPQTMFLETSADIAIYGGAAG